jgi:hypothetical protein
VRLLKGAGIDLNNSCFQWVDLVGSNKIIGNAIAGYNGAIGLLVDLIQRKTAFGQQVIDLLKL